MKSQFPIYIQPTYAKDSAGVHAKYKAWLLKFIFPLPRCNKLTKGR